LTKKIAVTASRGESMGSHLCTGKLAIPVY
jgi:hypothetical protein